MTIEEKAKAYDEALERVNSKWHYKNQPCFVDVAEIFPELKESEDERISREITEFILTHRIDEPNDIEDTNSWLAWLEKQAPKKWSEEDESRVEDVIYYLDTAKVHYASTKALDDCIDWLKSLKNKVLPKQEWSDEDEELLQHCCGAVAAADYYTLEDKEEMENWLKSLKQRMEQ
jgi:hypothetical protein